MRRYLDMNVKERIAYVRGLIEGSEFYGKDAQAKSIWENLLRICDDLADSITDLEVSLDETDDFLESIDADLADLESEIYDLDDDDDDEYDSDFGLGDVIGDSEIVEMDCPSCGEEVTFEEDFLYDPNVEITCPSCGGIVYATGDAAAATVTNDQLAETSGEDQEPPEEQ
jgi:predicted RNA-binding Zn-ribbon protein involved in translation (DUF1610 family)